MWLIALLIAVAAFLYFGRKYLNSSHKFGFGTSFSGDADKRFWGTKKEATKQAARLLVALIAKVAKGDGVISKDEAAYIGAILSDIAAQVSEAGFRDELKAVFNEAKDDDILPEKIAAEYRQFIPREYCDGTIRFLLNIAYIDNDFSPGEQAVLRGIARGFGLKNYEIERIFNQFKAEFKSRTASNQSPAQRDPWAVLGVGRDADFDTIKKAYRKLARENHPDFMMSHGETVVSDATKKLQEINEAYNILKEKFGK